MERLIYYNYIVIQGTFNICAIVTNGVGMLKMTTRVK